MGWREAESVRLLVGQYWDTHWRGSLRCFTWNGREAHENWRIQGDEKDFLGWSTSLGPDADADGTPDVFVGVPRFEKGPGRVILVSGRNGHKLATIDGSVARDEFGYDLDFGGDLDADAIPELLIGAPGPGAENLPGSAHVLSGKTLQFLGSTTGANKEDAMGTSVRFVGDLNSDGVPDYCAASWCTEAVYVWSGHDRSLLRRRNGTAWTAYGWRVSEIGDLDGDLVGEIVITARDAYETPVEVLSGTSGKVIRRIGFPHSKNEENGFGNSIACLPDIDGDGKAEIAVGAPGYRKYIGSPIGLGLTDHERERRRSKENRRGYVVVYSTGTWQPLFEVRSARTDDWFGVTLARLPDCDGDGVDDLFVGGGPGGGRVASIHSSRSGKMIWELAE